MSCAWLFNLDADDELASAHYSRSARTLARIEKWQEQLGRFCRSGERIAPLRGPADLGQCEGRLWCATPSAVQRARELELKLPALPALDVLRAVNGRSFLWGLGDRALSSPVPSRVEGAQILAEDLSAGEVEEQINERVASTAELPWVLKAEHGFAGRGLHRIQGSLSSRDLQWLCSARKSGPVHLEPWCLRERDLVIHGLIQPAGGAAMVKTAPVLVQQCKANGAWIETRPPRAGELDAAWSRELQDHASVIAKAMASAGYFGPFGIDAFVAAPPPTGHVAEGPEERCHDSLSRASSSPVDL